MQDHFDVVLVQTRVQVIDQSDNSNDANRCQGLRWFDRSACWVSMATA